MYINFYQNRVSIDQSKPCTQSYLQKIVSCIICNLQFEFRTPTFLQTCIIGPRTCISIFSKIGLVDLSKPCTQVYLQIFANCINLQLAIRISKNHAFRTCTTPSRTFRPILRLISQLDNELPRKEIISTDGRTGGQTSRTTTIGSFFRKKKKLLKTREAISVILRIIDRLPSVVSWESYLIVLYWKNNKIVYLLNYYNLVKKKASTVVCTSLLKETIA